MSAFSGGGGVCVGGWHVIYYILNSGKIEPLKVNYLLEIGLVFLNQVRMVSNTAVLNDAEVFKDSPCSFVCAWAYISFVKKNIYTCANF